MGRARLCGVLLAVLVACSNEAERLDALPGASDAGHRADVRVDGGLDDGGLDDAGLDDVGLDDAGSEPPVVAWAPEPRAWSGYPAHPFRDWIEPPGAYRRVVGSPDGRAVVAGEGGLAAVERHPGGRVSLAPILPGLTGIAGVALSADGRMVVAAGGEVTVVSPAAAGDPVVVGTFDPGGPATGVALSPDGGTAFVTTGAALVVLDVRDPAAPARLGSLDEPRLQQVVVAPGGQAAFAADGEGLVVLDLRDAAAPAVVGRLAVEGTVTDVVVSRDSRTVFVAHWRGVSIIDVADPAAPAVVGSTVGGPAGYANAVALSADERTLFVARGGALEVFDLGDRRAPSRRASYEVPGALLGIGLLDEHRALLAASSGVLLLDLRNPGELPLVGHLAATPDQCWRLTDVQLSAAGDTAFVAAGGALLVVDVADPGQPTLLATAPGSTANLSLAADGRTLFAAGPDTLAILDVGDRAAPATVGTFDHPSAEPMDVALSSDGRTAYLATEGGGGLDIVDVADPRSPSLLAHLYIRHTRSVVLSADEQNVFVTDPYENGLVVIDVRDARNPVAVGRLAYVVEELALSPEGSLLAATSDAGLLLIDVRDPAAPVVVATLESARGRGDVAFSADGRTLFVAAGELAVVDVTDPGAPALLGRFDSPGEPVDLAIAPDGGVAVAIAEGVTPCVALVDVGGPPSLEVVGPPAGGVQRYRLRWIDRYPDHPEQIAWHATGGQVVVSAVDQSAGTALVDWTLPMGGAVAPGLAVAVGNHHYFQVAYSAP